MDKAELKCVRGLIDALSKEEVISLLEYRGHCVYAGEPEDETRDTLISDRIDCAEDYHPNTLTPLPYRHV